MQEHQPGSDDVQIESSNRQGIALCLSGGGFRASLFHLGVLRRLHELGVLQQVRTISTVSGGTILAGFLADRMAAREMKNGLAFTDWETEVSLPFRRFTARDFRTLPMLLHLPWNWLFPGPRIRQIARQYESRLTQLKLKDLPKKPEFVLSATDLVFGVNWEFRQDYAGDFMAGYTDQCREWPLAWAVAASACFPPLFGPFPVEVSPESFKRGAYRKADRKELLSNLCLSDGGVYDNMGLEPVWKSHEYVLVSDCGAPFSFTAGKVPLLRHMRYVAIASNQSLALRKRLFFEGITDCRFKGSYWGIGGTVHRYSKGKRSDGYSVQLVEEIIDDMRTDLDSFSEAEAKVLENHGYLVADSCVEQRVRELIAVPAALKVPHPEWMDETAVTEALRDSHLNLSLARIRRQLEQFL